MNWRGQVSKDMQAGVHLACLRDQVGFAPDDQFAIIEVSWSTVPEYRL